MSEHAHGHGHGHQDSMDMFTEQAWEERYRAAARIWSGRPNPQLVAEASDLTAGTAVDVGCGEGADAIWLAEQGWKVTAVDFATAALERAAGHAAERGVGPIDWVHADVTTWDPGAERFDLVSAQFMHLPPEPRAALFARLAVAVAPGGTLLIVGHHITDLDTTMPRTPIPERFFTAADVAATLDDGWEIVTAEARPRTATDPEGREVTLHDAVLNARRRG